jgi:hypothetical protein
LNIPVPSEQLTKVLRFFYFSARCFFCHASEELRKNALFAAHSGLLEKY